MTARSRRALWVALSLLVIGPAPALAARPSQKKAIWGPLQINGRSAFPTYRDLGVGVLQQHLNWNDVAARRPKTADNPGDPAYHWPAALDPAVKEGARYGVRLSLLVSGTPPWANGGRDARWRPTKTADFANFMTAAAKRYPGVHLWMIWGEPDKGVNFQPSGSKAPRAYAPLLDAAYGALKRVSRRNLVIGGNSWTVGTPVVRTWIHGLRLPSGKPPRMDLYGHNPYTVRRPKLSSPPLSNGKADFSDLDTLVKWIDRDLGRTPSGKPIRVFISELSFPTGHANNIFNFHVSERVQSEWLTDALRITRNWSRIYTFGYFTLVDQPANSAGDQAETGLIRRDGSRKPAYYAYRRG